MMQRLFAFLTLLLLAGGYARAQLPAGADEAELKAAILFNFAMFTEWPTDTLPASAPLRLCVFQGNALLTALSGLQEKHVNGHRLVVRTLPASPGASQLAACHLLVLDAQDRERWPQLKHELANSSVLTVADDRTIGANGAMISFGIDNRRVGFDVDLVPVRMARLSLSSKLLRLARSVQ
ncbi:YfiR family protein [Pseudoduganella violaceinigra]|uniref:YfiR family protein n=1 Tax=Pseudoduganella violaceinigra TaxID=246602 RepID=UPI0004197426|nr:YfiR family protein [Pseudoduganella violaceinigra]